MPDTVSLHTKCAVTGLLFQPATPGAGLSATVMEGGCRSMLNGAVVTDAVFPAPSMTDPESAHAKCTVTALLTMPLMPGSGIRLAQIAGLVRSMLIPA